MKFFAVLQVVGKSITRFIEQGAPSLMPGMF
jgi:hypothetical protein